MRKEAKLKTDFSLCRLKETAQPAFSFLSNVYSRCILPDVNAALFIPEERVRSDKNLS